MSVDDSKLSACFGGERMWGTWGKYKYSELIFSIGSDISVSLHNDLCGATCVVAEGEDDAADAAAAAASPPPLACSAEAEVAIAAGKCSCERGCESHAISLQRSSYLNNRSV